MSLSQARGVLLQAVRAFGVEPRSEVFAIAALVEQPLRHRFGGASPIYIVVGPGSSGLARAIGYVLNGTDEPKQCTTEARFEIITEQAATAAAVVIKPPPWKICEEALGRLATAPTFFGRGRNRGKVFGRCVTVLDLGEDEDEAPEALRWKLVRLVAPRGGRAANVRRDDILRALDAVVAAWRHHAEPEGPELLRGWGPWNRRVGGVLAHAGLAPDAAARAHLG
ncbi:MAG: hypothetical protein HY791_36310 [Deltaproteobacteria bacterium]|nr:hypothetical protein [Deltaproteobacteria bacterium]